MHLHTTFLGLMVTGVLSSPLSTVLTNQITVIPTEFLTEFLSELSTEFPANPTQFPVTPTEFTASATPSTDPILEYTSNSSPAILVSRHHHGSLMAGAAAQQVVVQQDPDEVVRSLALELQQPRDFCPASDPDCTTTDEEDGALLSRDVRDVCFCESKESQCVTQETCVSVDFDSFVQPPTETLLPKGASDLFCACPTHGDGTCIEGMEYCTSTGDANSRLPLCICAVDERGYCKTDLTVCSDNANTGTARHFSGGNEADSQWCLAMVSADGRWSPNHNLCVASGLQINATASALNATQKIKRQDPSLKLLEPSTPNPDGASTTYTNSFGIAMVQAQSRNVKPPAAWKEIEEQCFEPGWFKMSLVDGKLLDNQGRTGYIASNQQFQFDNPPQAGTIYNSGFFVKDGVLGLGGDSTWISCTTGAYSNIYAEPIADYCQPVFLQMIGYDGDCVGDEK